MFCKYSDAEIESAINVVIDYFKEKFDGCTLTEITYLGVDILADYQGFTDRNKVTDVIVLALSFDVDTSGGNGLIKSEQH